MIEIYKVYLIVVILLVWWCKHHNLSFEPKKKKEYWHLLYEIGSKYRNFALISFEVRIEAKSSSVMFKWYCIREDDNHFNTYSKNSMMSRFHELTIWFSFSFWLPFLSILFTFLLNLFFPFSLIIKLWMIVLCSSMPCKTAKRHLTIGRCQKVDTNIIKRITKRQRSNAVKIYSIDGQNIPNNPNFKTLLSLIILTYSWLKKPWCHIIIISLWSRFVICLKHLVRTWYYGWQLWIILYYFCIRHRLC